MYKRRSNLCILIVLLLLYPQALAAEATPEPWRIYQIIETSEEQVDILVDCSDYRNAKLCVVNVDEGSFLPELMEGMTLFWNGDEHSAAVTWDTRRRELAFCYRPDSKKPNVTSVVGELLFSYYNADGERIHHDRVSIVLTDSGLRLSIKPVEEVPAIAL